MTWTSSTAGSAAVRRWVPGGVFGSRVFLVVDVRIRAEDQVGERTAGAFAATERACSAVGWEFSHVGVPASSGR
ncbi:hypothetical protein [Streptomyces sp. NBC_00893]|uniref:hypothetical protein n=1 Tax=Streptomyces sp. NBC_00893 TaxID=2975862 RepID=UPI0022531AB3|nr:hypothetical protein [Streptomyces sp. NBC_00893]MCX4844493.1 hypothetical protein [Streptomyces sp. NBC_00893]